ncbi:MAG: hypothetical protein QF819_03705 [Gemmatimonadota bacterium]|jgi:ribosome maturation factor RimP|nr:hypothetical protein [Gemmatimonadota bacterium]MDP6802267.1 hypothetical protein [Gemmatimonadota bacterium]MDP7031538.1 hypothetical protein [Gemmatimonadota bacterium]
MQTRERELFVRLEDCVAAQGAVLVDLVLGRAGRREVMRLVIHAEEGVTHELCGQVTSAVARELDAGDSPPDHYVLEVTSPGLGRTMRNEEEFDLFKGRRVRVRTKMEDTERELLGVCAGTRGESVVIGTESEGEVAIPWSEVNKAQLDPDEPRSGGPGGKRE